MKSLALEQELALNYTPRIYRGRLNSAFALDSRLAALVSGTTEPLLGKMRLAWWRDTLRAPVSARPSGDLVLDSVNIHWDSNEDHLIALIDGWEYMLVEGGLDKQSLGAFISGRIRYLQFYAGETQSSDTIADLEIAARNWAIADVLGHLSDSSERALALKLAQSLPQAHGCLPAANRGLAVLSALGRRAIAKGGSPLMEGRGAAVAAFKAGMLRR